MATFTTNPLSILFILLSLMRSEGERHAAEEAVLLCAAGGMLSCEGEMVERLGSKSAVGFARRCGGAESGRAVMVNAVFGVARPVARVAACVGGTLPGWSSAFALTPPESS